MSLTLGYEVAAIALLELSQVYRPSPLIITHIPPIISLIILYETVGSRRTHLVQ